EDLQRAIRAGRHDNHPGPRAVKMTEHPLAVLVGSAESSRIAIDAQNGCGHLRAVLFHNEPECLLAFGRGRLERNLPRARDRGDSAGRGRRLDIPRRLEIVLSTGAAVLYDDVALELPFRNVGCDGGEVMLDLEHQLASLEASAGRRLVRIEAVIERPFEG